MKLIELPGIYEVARYPAGADEPPRVTAGSFYSATRTLDELSVVRLAGVVKNDGARLEPGWRCIKVAGTLDFALTGILASIAVPLADAKISIFVLSTFDTDYVLVKGAEFGAAKAALQRAGFSFD
jgi:hypothetical protein